MPLKELGSYGRSEIPSPQLLIGSAAAFTNTTPPLPTPALVWAFWITGRAEENRPIVFLQAGRQKPALKWYQIHRDCQGELPGLGLGCPLLFIFRAQVPVLFLCDPWFFAPLVPSVSHFPQVSFRRCWSAVSDEVGLPGSGGSSLLQPHSWLAMTCPVLPHPVAASPPGTAPTGQGAVRHLACILEGIGCRGRAC